MKIRRIFSKMGDAIVKALKYILRIESPSRKMMEVWGVFK